jgi:hypothetical protein
MDERQIFLVNESAIFGGFQGWMADYTRMWGFGDFRGIERIVRNSTIKVGIFSLDPNIGKPFFEPAGLNNQKIMPG